jgi:hypothetical protein
LVSNGAGALATWQTKVFATHKSVFVQTANKTVANTTTETTLFTTGLGSLTILGNTMVVGTNYRFRARGYISNTGGPFIQVKIKIGSVTVMDTTSTATFGITGNQQWEIQADFTVRAIGSGTSANVIGQGIFYYATSQSTQEQVVFSTNTAVSSGFDSTTSQAIDCTFQWSAANASTSITCTNFTIEQLN